MIKGLIFDKDDTLIDLGTYWYLPTIKTIETIMDVYNLHSNTKIKKELEYLGGFDNGRLIEGSVVVCGTNYETMQLFKKYLYENKIIVDEDFCKWGTKLLEDNCLKYGQVIAKTPIDDLFEILNQKEIKLGLITSDNHKSAINCLQKLNIEKCFDIIIAADDSPHHKPDKELADYFLKKTKLKKEEVLIIGDSASDMNLAKNSGIKGISLNRNINADYYINELKEVTKFL